MTSRGDQIPAAPTGLQAEEQAALLRVATLVAREVPEELVFAATAEEVARVLGAEATGVMRYLGAERGVIVGVWREGGTRGMPVNAELDFDPRTSAVGLARSTRRPARADSYEGARGELPVVMRAIGLQSSVAAPVLVHQAVWGAIVASTSRDRPLAEGCEQRLEGFAALVGLAVASADARRGLVASRLRLVEAADEARRRLERDLHEGAQQQILALVLKLRVASTRAASDADPKPAGLLEQALTDAVEANASLRALALGIYPTVLSERGLAFALQAVAARSAVPVHLHKLPSRRFAPVVELTAYFTVVEALANAAAHARATEVALLVADGGDRLVVEVRDDGLGGADARAGWGLRALADRVAAVGGRLDVESPPRGGTRVRVEVPVER